MTLIVQSRRNAWLTATESAVAERSNARAVRLLRRGAAFEACRDLTPRMMEPSPEAPDQRHFRAVEKDRPAPQMIEVDGREIPVSSWHAARAKGLVKKWERIKRCEESQDFIQATCSPGCSGGGKVAIGCGHRECPRCRKIKAKRIRRDVDRARHSLTNRARELRCDRSHRERFVTFTAPHYAAQGGESAACRRVRILFDAWKVVNRWLRLHMIEQSDRPEICHYWRVFEWTEGDDGEGHPHFHVLVHGPWIDREELHAAWETALAMASGERREVNQPDIRLVSGRAATDELVKYMVKDLSDRTHCGFVDPLVFGDVFIELIGRRCKQPSKGLGEWIRLNLKKEPCFCRECNAEMSFGFARERTVIPRPSQTGPPEAPNWAKVVRSFVQLSLF